MVQLCYEYRKVVYVALDGDPIAKLFKPAFCFGSHNEGLVAVARRPLLQRTHEDAHNVSVRGGVRSPERKNRPMASGFPGNENLS